MPYHYASLWDHPNFSRKISAKAQDIADHVPKELKVRIKKAHGQIGLLRSLEEDIRSFLSRAHGNECLEGQYSDDMVDVHSGAEDSEEEIVFVSKKTRNYGTPVTEKVVFESLANDSSASFR